jgi:hypothetical protein
VAKAARPGPAWLVGTCLLAGLVTVCDSCPAAQARQEKMAIEAVPVTPDEHFDQVVFQNDRNAAGARKRMDALLALQVEDLDRACKLTAAQKQKLLLMGRGDIKRFFDRYETLKQRFHGVKHDQQRLQQVWQDARPLQIAVQAGFFHDESLLHKALHRTLDAEQTARYDALLRERQAFRHRANIELTVTVLEQAMPLRDAQRRAFIEFLLKETKPPRRSGQYEFYVSMYQLGRLPEEKVKPLFNDAQWKVVSRMRDQYKGIEEFLKQHGLLPDERAEAEPADEARVPALPK